MHSAAPSGAAGLNARGLISVAPPALRVATINSHFGRHDACRPHGQDGLRSLPLRRTHVPIRGGILLHKKTGQALPCPVLTFESQRSL